MDPSEPPATLPAATTTTTTTAAPESAPPAPPVTLVVGLAAYALGALVLGIVFSRLLSRHEHDDLVRWNLVDVGVDLAALVLLIAGARELARNTFGRAALGAKVAFGAAIALLVARLVVVYFNSFYLPRHGGERSTIEAFFQWQSRAWVTAFLALVAGTVAAAWSARRARQLAVPIAVVALCVAPYDFYARYLGEAYAKLSPVYGPPVMRGLLFSALAAMIGLALFAARPRADAGRGAGPAGKGFGLVATALYAQLCIAASGVFLLLVMFLNRGEGGGGLVSFWQAGLPLANAIAGAALCAGLARTTALASAGAPRVRLHVACAALTFVTAVGVVKAASAVELVWGSRSELAGDDATQIVAALPIAGPAIAALGLLALASAVRAIASALGSAELLARTEATLVVVVVGQLVAIGAPYLILTAREPTPSLVLGALVIAAGAAIVIQLHLARLCRMLAPALRAREDLAIATVVLR